MKVPKIVSGWYLQAKSQPEQIGFLLVGARGFEPPASSSRTTRATGLRYAPNLLPRKNSSGLKVIHLSFWECKSKNFTENTCVFLLFISLWKLLLRVIIFDLFGISQMRQNNFYFAITVFVTQNVFCFNHHRILCFKKIFGDGCGFFG